MGRRLPWLVLAAFVVVPVLEIYVLIRIGQVIGAGWTIVLLIADAVVGSWLVKHEGRRAWRALHEALAQGRPPARELADGALIVLGGALMISPGFVSDVFGLLCVLPVTRPWGRRLLAAALGRRLTRVGVTGVRAPGARTGHTRRPRGPDDVVRGDVVD